MSNAIRGSVAVVGVGLAGLGEAPGRTAIEILAEACYRALSGGRIAPGGDLPVNTNGGGLSCCHPGMYGIFTIVEAVRQLRGGAGERQVRGAEVALCHGSGGRLSSQVTALLGTEATL